MKENKSIASFVLIVLLTLSAWVLAIITDIVLYWWVPNTADVFNDFDVKLPKLTGFFIYLSSLPIYMPIAIAIVATVAALLSQLLGWYRRRLMIILAFIANVLIIAFLTAMYLSIMVGLAEILNSTARSGS
jgi:hypothetical protein